MLQNKVLEYIIKNNLVLQGDKLLVGISGGPDSVCLLHILQSISQTHPMELFPVHINHKLRKDESDADEAYVKDFCMKLQLPLLSKTVDVAKFSEERGLTLEEAGREARYEAFEDFRVELGAKSIAVAHNRKDQAETVLMRIIRGTGLDGLKGMEPYRGKIIRPLLTTHREEIEEYCRQWDLQPRTDSSNLRSEFTRNRVRLELMPQIDSLFHTDIEKRLITLAELVREDVDFFESHIREIYPGFILQRDPEYLLIDRQALSVAHGAVSRRILRRAIEELKGSLAGIEKGHIEGLLQLACTGQVGAELHLPKGLRASRSYDWIRISRGGIPKGEEGAIGPRRAPETFHEGTGTGASTLLKVPGITDIANLDERISAVVFARDAEEAIDKNPENGASGGDKSTFERSDRSNTQFFDYDKLKSGINIRCRLPGDVFKPIRSNGTKKLKEYFIDRKVCREMRDRIPLISMGQEVVWIIGMKISDKFKVTDNTKNILKLVYESGIPDETQ